MSQNKVLFIANYSEITGYAHAARNYILAMDAVGIDVVPRRIYFGAPEIELPNRILELEQKSDRDCDICIQCTLPHFFDYCGRFKKNIGLYFSETSHFRNSPWAEHINLMDEAWVCCNQNYHAAFDSNVKIPIKILPIPCDITKYERKYKPLDIPELKDKFVFYYIGEAIVRKNLPALLKAFHCAFEPHDQVALCLKVSLPGSSPQQCGEFVQKMCQDIKDGLKLYPDKNTYHREVIIASRMSEEEIMRLHATCDCFVSTSYGEAWNEGAFDAMAMGKTPIVTAGTGMDDWIWKYTNLKSVGNDDYIAGGVRIMSDDAPVFLMNQTYENLYVGNESWKACNIDELICAMQDIYVEEKHRNFLSNSGIKIAQDFSYENVGQQIKQILEN